MVAEHVENIKHPDVIVQASDPLSKMNSGGSKELEIEAYMDKFMDMSENAKHDDNKDKHMSLKEGLSTFPKAAMWSVILSSSLIMEGYDVSLLGSLFALDSFKKKFGEHTSNGNYEITAQWQTGLGMGSNVGQILGLALAGLIADRIGYRRTLMGSLFLAICFIFITFFAINLPMLLCGQILMGFPLGTFQTLTVSYASEVCPTALRVYLTTYVNVCWVFGQLVSSGVLRAVNSSDVANSYRIPFAVQWVWPIPIMIGIYLAPESPWWLVRTGKLPQAKKSLMRLLTVNEDLLDKEVLANMMLQKIQMTLKEEDLKSTGSSYIACFKRNNIRRTRITAFVWLIQGLSGSSLMGYSTYFYQQAGLNGQWPFNFTIIQYCLGIIGTLFSWILSQKAGRFTIYFYGLCVLCCILFTIGCLGIKETIATSWATGVLLMVFTLIYDSSIGPLCYCIVAEIPSNMLRTKSIIIARNTNNLASIFNSVIGPYMLNPTEWNWKAKAGFLYSGFCFCGAIWCWFELPETKKRTFAELDVLFQSGISSRNFKSTDVEVFNTDNLVDKLGENGIKNLVGDDNEKSKMTV